MAEPYWEDQWHLCAPNGEWPQLGQYIQMRTTHAGLLFSSVHRTIEATFGGIGVNPTTGLTVVRFIPAFQQEVPTECGFMWRGRIVPMDETAEEREVIDAYT